MGVCIGWPFVFGYFLEEQKYSETVVKMNKMVTEGGTATPEDLCAATWDHCCDSRDIYDTCLFVAYWASFIRRMTAESIASYVETLSEEDKNLYNFVKDKFSKYREFSEFGLLAICAMCKWQELKNKEEVAAKIAALENPENSEQNKNNNENNENNKNNNLTNEKEKEKMIEELKNTPPIDATFYVDDTIANYREAVSETRSIY